jgi:hypothetical protein
MQNFFVIVSNELFITKDLYIWILSKKTDRHKHKVGFVVENKYSSRYAQMGASCVQSFDDSLSDAIRMTYRISLRSSSLWEPRHPLLKVFICFLTSVKKVIRYFNTNFTRKRVINKTQSKI